MLDRNSRLRSEISRLGAYLNALKLKQREISRQREITAREIAETDSDLIWRMQELERMDGTMEYKKIY